MITREEITHIGKFNKTHGIGGEISATINIPTKELGRCRCIVCDIDGIYVPFFIDGQRRKSSETVLVSIDGIKSDLEAQSLVNKDIYILHKDYNKIMDSSDEVPVDFFINFNAVINDDIKGCVIDIDDSTANVLFVIKQSNDKEILIPAVDDFIESVDTESRTIHFNIPIELIEL